MQKVFLIIFLVLVGGIGGFALGAFISEMQADPELEIKTEDLIRLNTPVAGEEISTPLVAEGEVRGLWFVQDGFPVRLERSDDQEVIAEGWAEIEGSEMVPEFMPFTAELDFEVEEETEADLVLERESPGDPEELSEVKEELRISSLILRPIEVEEEEEDEMEEEGQESEEGEEEESEEEDEEDEEDDEEEGEVIEADEDLQIQISPIE